MGLDPEKLFIQTPYQLVLQLYTQFVGRWPINIRLKSDPHKILNLVVTTLRWRNDRQEVLEFEGDQAETNFFISGQVDFNDPSECWVTILPPR